jgi:hypothetical protein
VAGHLVAGPHASRQHADLVAGRKDVGQHEDLLVGHAFGDPVGRGAGVRDADVAGLGAVEPAAEDPAASSRALPVAALAAELAGSAAADAGDEYPVARREPVHAVADLLDGSHGLVAENPPRTYLRYIAGQDVQVGAADRRRVNPDDGVAFVSDLRVRNFLPGPLARAVVHERSHVRLRVSLSSQLKPCRGRRRRDTGRRSHGADRRSGPPRARHG